jgi:DNA mismatch repair protein MutL
MARIRRLPPTLASQIAAGEVVERPASAVKELLENAADAAATRVDVEAARGGTDLIRVVDNGCGIDADDLPLAFARHATSKLAAEDLCRVGTLGFRGEALAALGSVAQVRLQSRPAGQASGAEVSSHGGELSAVVPWGGAPGTRVEVRHLFYNTPARRKFLKGAAAEMGHVAEAFTRLALAHLGTHWALRHNGKLVYEVPASAGLLDRVGLFFGEEVRDSLYMVQAQEGPLTLGGYVGARRPTGATAGCSTCSSTAAGCATGACPRRCGPPTAGCSWPAATRWRSSSWSCRRRRSTSTSTRPRRRSASATRPPSPGWSSRRCAGGCRRPT